MGFFFQAEDGIRDLTVTGVQTCALPIYGQSSMVLMDASRLALVFENLLANAVQHSRNGDRIYVNASSDGEGLEVLVRDQRSEERRVGKECRTRWAAFARR